ncbi:unnamed protein product [Camellia sinensis]
MASEPVNVNEFQELARQALPNMYFDFYNGRIDMSTTIFVLLSAFSVPGEIATTRAAASPHEDKGSCLEAIATGMLDASLSWKDIEWVVRAVGGKNHVLFDGGVRRGTDISKVGRPVIYGLAAKGEYGVRRVIEMLKDELELTIALSGCPTVNDIIKSLVRTELDGLNCWL